MSYIYISIWVSVCAPSRCSHSAESFKKSKLAVDKVCLENRECQEFSRTQQSKAVTKCQINDHPSQMRCGHCFVNDRGETDSPAKRGASLLWCWCSRIYFVAEFVGKVRQWLCLVRWENETLQKTHQLWLTLGFFVNKLKIILQELLLETEL